MSRKGIKNRRTLLKELGETESPKVVIHAVFQEMGGFPAFLKWAQNNPDKFYKDFYCKTAPSSRAGDVHRGGAPREHEASTNNNSKIKIKDFSGK